MMLIGDFNKDINSSLKEIQEKTGKQVEAIKKETQKSLKGLQENTTKLMKELNTTIQELIMKDETIKKSEREATLKIENLGKKSGVIEARINNRIQKIAESISGAEDTIEEKTVHENAKCKSS